MKDTSGKVADSTQSGPCVRVMQAGLGFRIIQVGAPENLVFQPRTEDLYCYALRIMYNSSTCVHDLTEAGSLCFSAR